MRKQYRIANQQQNRPPQSPDTQPKPEREQVKGSASGEQMRKPPREGGKLPLPD